MKCNRKLWDTGSIEGATQPFSLSPQLLNLKMGAVPARLGFGWRHCATGCTNLWLGTLPHVDGPRVAAFRRLGFGWSSLCNRVAQIWGSVPCSTQDQHRRKRAHWLEPLSGKGSIQIEHGGHLRTQSCYANIRRKSRAKIFSVVST